MARKTPKKTGKPAAKRKRTPKKRPKKPIPFPITADDLREDPENPRSISEAALEGLGYGLAEFADLSGITWNRRTGTLVTGHQRMKSLRERHGESLILNQTHGDNFEIVTPNGESYKGRVVDWDVDKAAAANLAANSPLIQGEFTSGVGAILDRIKKTIPDMVRPLMLDDLRALQPNGTGEAPEGRTDPDAVPEATKTPVVQSGDLWICGEHRLLCGDSLDPGQVETVLDGALPAMVWSDPPYGLGGYAGRGGKLQAVRGDDAGEDDLVAFFRQGVAPGVYVCCEFKSYPRCIAARGEPRSLIVWAKQSFGMGSGYRRQHEFIGYWGSYNGTTESDLWRVDREGAYDHPTQKPVELVERALRNSTERGGLIFDPFLGSGTAIISAERLGRRAFGIEIEPKYIQVALQRWADFTGKDPVREDGTSFQDLVAAKP